MKFRPLKATPIAALLIVAAATSYWQWWSHRSPHYLPPDSTAFVAQFAPPSANDSPRTRAELDELLALQAARSPAALAAARADRKKDLSRFYDALGITPGKESPLAPVRSFMDRVESDVSIYVRAAKLRFARQRPYVIERRLEPCTGGVKDDQSYPSGHSSYAYTVALILAEMVPERREALMARADEYARQRMICGVHFASDIAAGRIAADWLVSALDRQPDFRAERARAAIVLRAALGLAPAN